MIAPFERFLAWERVSRDTIDFKKIYVDIAGDLVAGLMLSQIIYWHLPGHNGEPKLRVERDGHRWLAKRRTEWWAECRISAKQADRALALLEQRGLVVTMLAKFDGAPTKHIRLDPIAFLAAWEQAVEEGERGKSISTDGEKPILPEGKIDLAQRGRTLTETTAKTTTETTPIEVFEEDDASIIRRAIVDVARGLGDQAPEQSTGQRGVNLWRDSGLSRAEFMKLIYRARDRIREYQGKQPPGKTIKSKVAYFFSVLESMIDESA